jgi:hypothetical protein
MIVNVNKKGETLFKKKIVTFLEIPCCTSSWESSVLALSNDAAPAQAPQH